MARLLCVPCLLLAIAIVLLLPLESAAAPPGCTCGYYAQTPWDWAQAGNCEDATAQLISQLTAAISCPEGPGLCSRTNHIGPCHHDVQTGLWQVDGYATYRCWACDE